MENANFMGRLLCYADDILTHLSSHPHAADTFLCRALKFEGSITQSGLDPTPNPHHSTPAFHTPTCQPTNYQLHVAAAAEAMRLM